MFKPLSGLSTSIITILTLAGILLLPSTVEAEVTPSAGTIGTKVTITGSGFGSKKNAGSIRLGKSPVKVIKWSNTKVVGQIYKKAAPGEYKVSLKLADKKVKKEGTFEIKAPLLSKITPKALAQGGDIQINGKYLGSAKPTVVLYNPKDADAKPFTLKVTKLKTSKTGKSDKLTVKIPGKVPNGTYKLSFKNKIATVIGKGKITIDSFLGVEPDATSYGLVIDDSVPVNQTTSLSPLPVSGLLLSFKGFPLPAEIKWQNATVQDASGMLPVAADGSWSGQIPLAPGDNELIVSIPTVGVERRFIVTLNEGYQFSGPLQLAPDVAYLNETRVITARIDLSDSSSIPTSVQLVSTKDGVEAPVGDMLDNGDLLIGDEIEGDNIFTLQFEVAPVELHDLHFRVVVSLQDSEQIVRSEVSNILVSERLTDEVINQLITGQSNLQEKLEAASQGDVESAVQSALATLQSDPTVTQAGLSESGKGAWAIFESGVGGVVYAPEPGTKSGAASRDDNQAPQDLVAPETNYGSFTPSKFLRSAGNTGASKTGTADAMAPMSHATTMAESAENKVESSKAFAIAAQYFDWGEGDDIPKIVKKLTDDSCYSMNYIKYDSKGSGSVEDFKNLGGYGIVLVSSHGDSFYNGIFSLWEDRFGWNGAFGQVIVHSNMTITAENLKTYEDDLKAGRLVLWGNHYGMTPSFFSKYSGSLPNSLIYMSICRGSWNGSLANAFIGTGAGSFLGFSDYVAVSFCESTGTNLFDKLLTAGNDMGDAFIPGLKETDSDPAEFRLFGSNDLSILISGLIDGSFESGQITQAWETDGDARIITGLGQFSPVEGNYMAIISTGLGFSTSTGSLQQQLCLADEDTIEFQWNFLSEEWLEYVGTQFQDSFTVSIAPADNPSDKTILLSRTIDDLAGSVFPVSNSFDRGDVHATGWQQFSFTIPETLRNKTVVIEFFATDVGDSIYDSAVLIDDITISKK